MSRKRVVVLVAVIAVVALIAGGGALVFFTRVDQPALSASGALSRYARAIETGDLTTADELTPAPAASRPVGGAALADPANRITAVTTSIVSSTARSANGTMTFDLAGHRDTVKVGLAAGRAQLGLLPNWHVTTPVTTKIAVGVPADGSATVNGVEAQLGPDLTLTVYPGRYSVGLAADNTWYTSTVVTVDAGTAAVSVTPVVTPTTALHDAVLAQVKTAIDACVANADPAPSGCPFSAPTQGKVADFSWKLDAYPTVSFLDPTHFFISGGQATADYRESYLYIVNKQEEDPVAITGSGAITFSGGKAVATLRVP